jgi:hypothetical protein
MSRVLSMALISLLFTVVAPLEGLSRPMPIQDSPISVTDSSQRTWSSPDGKFRQEGKLVEIDGDKIKLETPEGKRLTAALSKLSADDKKFVDSERDRLSSDNPFSMAVEDNPFSAENSSGNTRREMSRGKPESVNLDLSRAKPISLQSNNLLDLSANHWKTKELADDIEPIQTSTMSFHCRALICFASSDNKFLIVSFEDPFGRDLEDGSDEDDFGMQLPDLQRIDVQELARQRLGNRGLGDRGLNNRGRDNRGPAQTGMKNWMELYRLPSGEPVGKYPLNSKISVVCDYDSKTDTVLVCGGAFGNDSQLQLLERNGDQLVLRTTCKAVGDSFRRPTIRSARFLADGKIVIHSLGELIVLSEGTLKPLYSISHFGHNLQLASDRQHGLVEHNGRKYEVDLIQGKCTAASEAASVHGKATIPSLDGKTTLEFGNRAVTIRDQTGSVQDEFYVPIFWPNPLLSWLDERTMRIETSHQVHLVDIDARVVLLELTKPHSSTTDDRGWNLDKQTRGTNCFFVISLQDSPAKSMAKLPDLTQCREALPKDADSLLLLKKGDRVALKINLEADPSITGEVETLIKKLLNERGVILDDSAIDQLQVSSAASQETVEYRRFGVPPWNPNATESVTVRNISNSIKLIRGGDLVWSYGSNTGAPGFILNLREGESVQQAVDRETGKPIDFWQSIKLPRHVALHPKGLAWFRYISGPNGYQLIQ